MPLFVNQDLRLFFSLFCFCSCLRDINKDRQMQVIDNNIINGLKLDLAVRFLKSKSKIDTIIPTIEMPIMISLKVFILLLLC